MRDTDLIIEVARHTLDQNWSKFENELKVLEKEKGLFRGDDESKYKILAFDSLLAAYKSNNTDAMAKILLSSKAEREDFIQSLSDNGFDLRFLQDAGSVNNLNHIIPACLRCLKIHPSSEFPNLFAKTKAQSKIPAKAMGLIKELGFTLHEWRTEDDGVVVTIEDPKAGKYGETQMNFFPMRRKQKLEVVVTPVEFAKKSADSHDQCRSLRNMYQNLINALEAA